MYSDWGWLLFLAVFIWLGILTYLIWQQRNFLQSLFPKEGERDIRKKFEEVLKSVAVFKEDIAKIENRQTDLEMDGLGHIQKVGLLRYNPYEDTGGDQSFSIAILDKGGSGFVLTSLHARGGTRVFAKSINIGKGDKYQLSREEKEVVQKALKEDE